VVSVLFVHGMGRSLLSGWLMLHKLRKAGFKTTAFSYSASSESFESITQRLTTQIIQMAKAGDYLVIGHSLGGVLLRSVLNTVPVIHTLLPSSDRVIEIILQNIEKTNQQSDRSLADVTQSVSKTL